MPRIFDNIDLPLLPELQSTLSLTKRADFCVGYFNLRGWRKIDSGIQNFSGGEGNCCRLLVGMHRPPYKELRHSLSILRKSDRVDNKTANLFKKQMAEEFRKQLIIGFPTNADEAGLRSLARHIKEKKLQVKQFLEFPLHAKLYLLYRDDPLNPIVGYLGSSNLTLSGLSKQGELNVDVLDHDATNKLSEWFENLWNDRLCVDISDELVKIIDESWASEKQPTPYQIYIKMAYHLAQEARAGLSEFRIPKEFGNKLFDFQKAAVKIAAHHLNKRGGVLIGDVVGLGKTLMATALARIFEDDYFLETLIICPKNLVTMWQDYCHKYRLRAKVLSVTKVINTLPDLRRYRLCIIDESHNLRNKKGKRYRAIKEYIQENECQCILLTATPYNKTYLDLSAQLSLFIADNQDLGIRPEQQIKKDGLMKFKQSQLHPRTLKAFEKSEFSDDWRELMRLYLVRRTRTFIKKHYAKLDPDNNKRFLEFEDGSRSYFPMRIPRTVKFSVDPKNPNDQYAKLFGNNVVDIINDLFLPRYGLGGDRYISPNPKIPPNKREEEIIKDLSNAGKRLMGFCRTNLFKRLESSGEAFILSIKRHILRNFIFLHAIKNKAELPIGSHDLKLFDSRLFDADSDLLKTDIEFFDGEEVETESEEVEVKFCKAKDFEKLAAKIYHIYNTTYKKYFKWIRYDLFKRTLKKDLKHDSDSLLQILDEVCLWAPEKDEKLRELENLLAKIHPKDKVLIFSQYADTVKYLETNLKERMNKSAVSLEGVTGDTDDPTSLAHRFSPESNEKRNEIAKDQELRVLIATDVLSEGQNLQDSNIIVNFDLPWAIIRLIQRAGRIDRIGQKADEILCYTFLPAEGVEKLIHLRERLRGRLKENAEVVGSDETFFEDDKDNLKVVDLYNEKSGILDDEEDEDVDLASYAFQIWKDAVSKDPKLKKIIPEIQPVAFSTKPVEFSPAIPEGVLVYLKTAEGVDALSWIDKNGKSVTESQYAILKAAECEPGTPTVKKLDEHHKLVKIGVNTIITNEKSAGGQLGRKSGARYRVYQRLKSFAAHIKDTFFDMPELHKALEEIYNFPLKQSAREKINRQLKAGIDDEQLAELVIAQWEDDSLCIRSKEAAKQEPQIICSMGLRNNQEDR